LLALQGITVLAFEHAISAPFCTRQLADLGARVIKIERPDGGDFARGYDKRVRGMSSHFVWCNRSKESMTLNMKRPEARNILARLLEHTDVIVQNLAPGVTERFGLSYAALSPKYPKLIVCDITGYGAGGPFGNKKAYDLLIQAESGFLSVTGSEKEPAKAGNSIADISAGMYAYSNILVALLKRTRTSKGSWIDVSMLESMVEWMGYPLYYSFDGADPPARNGMNHATIYPYGPFVAGDGKVVMFGLQNEREWAAFCEIVLKRPELAVEPRFQLNADRFAARNELDPIINGVLSSLSADEVLARLEAAQIANARVNTMAEVREHPQLKARRRWTEVHTPAGIIPALYPPSYQGPSSVRMDAVPSLGNQTDAILAELGYDASDISQLHAQGVV
jgi:itaconate CoA-transferase